MSKLASRKREVLRIGYQQARASVFEPEARARELDRLRRQVQPG